MNEELDQLKRDLTEMFYYGCTSKQVYTDYVKIMDNKIKSIMLQIADIYEEHAHMGKKDAEEVLGKQYQELWLELKEPLKQFHEELQGIFEVPKECVELANVTPEYCFQPKVVQKLEAEIEELQQKFREEKFYLEELKQRQEILDKISKELKEEKISEAKAVEKTAAKDVDLLKENYQKKQEKVDKFMENCDKGGDIKALIQRNLNEENTRQLMEKMCTKTHKISLP